SNLLFEYITEDKINCLSNVRTSVTVTLSSSDDNNDNNARQKAQLCRQSIDQTSDND
ncbi:unnamed protein product, partial [Didymodactylos carnosus]